MLLNQISFSYPYMLLIFPLLALILVYIYIKFFSNKKILFPSFFLLETTEIQENQGKRVKLPKRFFYELFILLIFSLLLSGIYLKSNDKNYLIFIDNSFSTKTKVSKYVSTFDNIKDNAISKLKSLPINARYKIISSNFDINSKLLTKDDAIKLINKIENSYSEDNISNYNFNVGNYNKIYIFTDKNINSNNPKLEVISNIKPNNSCNFSISNLNILEDMVYVTISSFCNNEAKVFLSLNCNNERLLKNKLEFFKENSVVENLKIPSNIINNDKYSLCKVSIESKNDILLEDNEAFFVYNKKASNIYLVNNKNQNNINEPNNKFIKLPFNIISIDESKLNNIKNEDIVIFNDTSLNSLPKHNAIIMNPTKDSLFFKNFINEPRPITYSQKGHLILSYINPLNLSFNKFVSIKNESPYYVEEILKAKDSIILGSLEHNGFKYIISGFSYLPYNDLQIERKILFLNSIKYLNKQYINDDYKLLPFSYEDKNTKKFVQIKNTGFFRINDFHEAFNFFSNNESNVLNNDKDEIKIINIKEKNNDYYFKNLIFDYLKKFLIFLLALELLYFIVKNFKNRK